MRESGKIFGYRGGIPYTITLKNREIVLKEIKKNDLFERSKEKCQVLRNQKKKHGT